MQSTISSFMKTRWALFLVLPVFICFKIPHLHYPFFVDEGWVYAPAVKMMYLHGPSLMPDAISPEYTRGHPLMFHFLCALWMKLFGASNTAIHSFPFFLSLIFLVALYEGCLRLFGRNGATLILLLVSMRVIFFVQSSFVYPEVMVALFAFLSLYFYSTGRYLFTALALFMLFFTKEGGLVIGAVIGIDAFVSLFRRNERLVRRFLRLASVAAPTCLIGLFFVAQKAKLGWYVLPEHTDLIKPDWNSFYVMFKSGMYWTYRGDRAMNVLVFFTILLSLIPALRYKNIRYLFLLPPAAVIYLQAEMFPVKAYDTTLWMILYLMGITGAVYGLLKLNKTLSGEARRFIVLLAISVVIFLFYSSLTQIAYRYLLVDIVFVLIFLAVCISTYIAAFPKNAYYFATCCVILIGAYGFYSNDRHEDTQLGAFGVMNVEMQELAYLQKENAYNKEIAYNCNWEQLRFTDTLQGFVTAGHTFTHMTPFPISEKTEYVLFGNYCDDKEAADYQRMLVNPDFRSVFKVRDGEEWVEVFKRK